MLEKAVEFLFEEGRADCADLDAELDRGGFTKLDVRPSTLLAWSNRSPRRNFLMFRLAERLGVPAMPLRFALDRELEVLGGFARRDAVADGAELVDVPQFESALKGCAYLNLSSGTSASRTIAFPSWTQLMANAAGCVQRFGLSPDRWYWCTFPFFAHAHELFTKPIATQTPVLGFDATAVERVNDLLRGPCRGLHILTTPHVATTFLARHLNAGDRDRIQFELAGEYVSLGVVDYLRGLGFKTIISWGSAETSGVAIADIDPSIPLSIGQALPGYDVAPRAVNAPGSLRVAGDAVPQVLARDGRLVWIGGVFESKDRVAYDGSRYLFHGRSDRQIKYHGTYIQIAQVEGWAKQRTDVDNAFLCLWEGTSGTELRLYIQCRDPRSWAEVDGDIKRRMFEAYGGIKIRIHCARSLAHTPTGKLIRDPRLQPAGGDA